MERVKKLCGIKGLSGYLSGIISGLAFTLSAACVQRLDEAVPPFQLNAVRYLAQAPICFFIAKCTKKTFRITPPPKVPWLVLLSILSVLNNTFYFTAAQLLPLGNMLITKVTVLYIATILLSKLFLNRDIHLVQIIFFMVILIGQFLLLQPYSPLNTEQNTTGSNILKTNQVGFVNSAVGYALVIGSAILDTLKAFVCRIHLNEVPTCVLSLWIGLLGLIASLLIMVYTEGPVLPASRLELLLLAGHAMLASPGSIMSSHAQQMLNPSMYGILTNMQQVFGFILQSSLPQILLQGHRNVLEGVGAGIIMLGIFVYVFIDLKIKSVTSLDNM